MGIPPEDINTVITRAQAGDSESIGRLFEMHSGRIYRFLAFRLSDPGDAEDITQTVFMEMIKSLKRYNPMKGAKFSTWLFQIARSRLIDHYRKQKFRISLEDVAEPSENAQTKDIVAYLQIDKALRRLPERYQTVLHLRYREGYHAAEIAKTMGTTAINVRVIQSRALKQLRKLLKESDIVPQEHWRAAETADEPA